MRQNCQIRFYCRVYWRHYASRKSPPETPLPQTTCTNNVLYGVPSSQPFILGSDIAPGVVQLLNFLKYCLQVIAPKSHILLVKCKRCYPGTCKICVGLYFQRVGLVCTFGSQPTCDYVLLVLTFASAVMMLIWWSWWCWYQPTRAFQTRGSVFFWSCLIPPSISGTNGYFPWIEIGQKWKPCKCGISENYGFDKGPVCKRAL